MQLRPVLMVLRCFSRSWIAKGLWLLWGRRRRHNTAPCRCVLGPMSSGKVWDSKVSPEPSCSRGEAAGRAQPVHWELRVSVLVMVKGAVLFADMLLLAVLCVCRCVSTDHGTFSFGCDSCIDMFPLCLIKGIWSGGFNAYYLYQRVGLTPNRCCWRPNWEVLMFLDAVLEPFPLLSPARLTGSSV